MLTKTFKINGTDYSAYAYKGGLSVSYEPVSGLPPKFTMDGTSHDDIIANKATYVIRLNPIADASVMQQIITTYRAPRVFLTIYDPGTGADITMLCKTGSIKPAPALVKHGNITYWQISDLVFTEV